MHAEWGASVLGQAEAPNNPRPNSLRLDTITPRPCARATAANLLIPLIAELTLADRSCLPPPISLRR